MKSGVGSNLFFNFSPRFSCPIFPDSFFFYLKKSLVRHLLGISLRMFGCYPRLGSPPFNSLEERIPTTRPAGHAGSFRHLLRGWANKFLVARWLALPPPPSHLVFCTFDLHHTLICHRQGPPPPPYPGVEWGFVPNQSGPHFGAREFECQIC